MCFVLLLHRVRKEYPLLVAANRDERRDRPSRPPFRWEGDPAFWAGRDESAGGTWLGANERGLFAAITNRRDEPPDPARPSRGALCPGLLRHARPGAARAWLERELLARPQNPFNLVCASPLEAWVATWRGDVRALEPGIHVVSDRGEADDDTLPVVRRARTLAERLDLAAPLRTLLAEMGMLCADTAGPDPLCRAGGPRGTVSSSLVALEPGGRIAAYLHAAGPPSETAYAAVALKQSAAWSSTSPTDCMNA